MIEAILVGHERVKDAYDRRSRMYDRVVAPYEWKFHVEAIDALAPRPGEAVLEVAVGPGRATVEIARREHGVDLARQLRFLGHYDDSPMVLLAEENEDLHCRASSVPALSSRRARSPARRARTAARPAAS